MTSTAPALGTITRSNGVAGQYAYSVPVTYPGEAASVVVFIGSTYGGPVVMVLMNGDQTFVAQSVMDRCGDTLTPEWVRRFFAPSDELSTY